MFGCQIFVSNFIFGGSNGYCFGTLISIVNTPPSYGVPSGPFIVPLSSRALLSDTGTARTPDVPSSLPTSVSSLVNLVAAEDIVEVSYWCFCSCCCFCDRCRYGWSYPFANAIPTVMLRVVPFRSARRFRQRRIAAFRFLSFRSSRQPQEQEVTNTTVCSLDGTMRPSRQGSSVFACRSCGAATAVIESRHVS